ncbi:GMC family oxidoreductase [Salinisphaera sp. Q1T1-3]|uniref:GMC family oxidoreductase n=1 Tax=Salinisphaera sp. Q1T1-3 TaxID=2321229 RepID=UPI000E759094|nr:GMC family oxidoreductase [Salinisphaera sp. Q1T1-3]RJS93040.1 GMC family oxidoreductase [Salinisphaera sp. Q1T1-3]
MAEHYDYVVVGGGSSACVAAARLVREADARVLILEAGPAKSNPIMAMPAGYMKFLAKDTYLTMHQTEGQEALAGRGPVVPQARVLGGGSTVNAMVYMRGDRADYADWNAHSDGVDWSFDTLLPYFTRQEDNDHLGAPHHGTAGSLKISHLGHFSPMSRAYVKTLQGMGLAYAPDFNNGRPAGVGFMQHTIDWRTRRRCSAYDAFIAPLVSDPRLTIKTDIRVTSLIIENGCVCGVHTTDKDGYKAEFRAAREVVLAAGAYQTPKLLMLSGIGPADELARHGIDVRVDAPGVGGNLQDHYEVPVVATTRGSYGYYGQDRGWPMIKAGLQYLLFRSGPVTTTGVETCAFVDPERDAADGPASIQMFCVPTVYLDRDVTGTDPGPGVTINSLLLRPASRGSVRLRSADPADDPVVDTRIYAESVDLERTITAFRMARKVLSHEPIRSLVEREIFPGPDVTSDEAIAEHCRRTVKTGYHPVGTCRIGCDDDPMAVLSPDLKVRGVAGLRVIDASMMPNIIRGNTNAAVMAVADRAADLMMADGERGKT